MLQWRQDERAEMESYIAHNREVPQHWLAGLYKRRDIVQRFRSIDSDGLELADDADLVNRKSHADGGSSTSKPGNHDHAGPEFVPTVRVQIKHGADKATALEAIDAIRAAVASAP